MKRVFADLNIYSRWDGPPNAHETSTTQRIQAHSDGHAIACDRGTVHVGLNGRFPHLASIEATPTAYLSADQLFDLAVACLKAHLYLKENAQ